MYEFPLTGAQKTFLRGLGQNLQPALKIGRGGLTPEFFAELQRLLRAHELVKLRFPGADREERAALCRQIADEGRCLCVGAVGHIALFYRQHPEPEQRKVALPCLELPPPQSAGVPPLPSLAEIASAASLVDAAVPPSPQFTWPLLNARTGCELWVKHDNHTAIGAFKIRGALLYLARLVAREPKVRGVIAATRGNFGQAVAFAASRHHLPAVIVVPRGNSPGKNRAMHALGAELIEHGEDFQAALDHSVALARARNLHAMPSYHADLVLGNAVSALAFLQNTPPLDYVYVPVGLGSGVCAMMAARDALGLSTRIIGVVADRAPAAALSFESRQLVTHPAATRIADGMACSTPNAEALDHMWRGVDRIVRVTDDEIEAAMRAYFSDTHNVAEGAAAGALAAVLREGDRVAGRRAGVVFTGGNVDAAVFARVLAAGQPDS